MLVFLSRRIFLCRLIQLRAEQFAYIVVRRNEPELEGHLFQTP